MLFRRKRESLDGVCLLAATVPHKRDWCSSYLNVIDANNNFRTISTTTSETSGTFSFTWTPDIPGEYAVIASFEGSNSYYGSSSETHFFASSPEAKHGPTALVNQTKQPQQTSCISEYQSRSSSL